MVAEERAIIMGQLQAAYQIDSIHDQQNTKKQFVGELTIGLRVDTTFVLGGLESRIASNGSRYLVAQLKDRTGTIRGLEFDRVSFGDLPPVGSVVQVKGIVEGARGNKRVKIASIMPTSDFYSHDYISSSLRPLDEMSKEFAQRVKSISTTGYKQLVRCVFQKNSLYKRFVEAPLSDSGALAYRGAALERTLKLCCILETLCRLYPQARKQLLMTSALLSEIGSVDSYELGATIISTEKGKNIPQDVLALNRIESIAENLSSQGAALAVESVLIGTGQNTKLALEVALFEQARCLLEAADKAQEQDFAQGIVGL